MIKKIVLSVFVFAITSLNAIGLNDPEFLAVKAVHERHSDTLFAIQGVVATAVGFDMQNRLSIHVYVTDPRVDGIPEMLENIPVHMLVTGPIKALKSLEKKKKVKEKVKIDPTSRFTRPVPIGVSTGHPDVTAGTIGCRVTDGENIYALSNNHVFANENQALIGDPVLQPGVYDDGTILKDVLGTLNDFVKIRFTQTATNIVDAALALSSPTVLSNETPANGYGKPLKTTKLPELAMLVQKYGRTTGFTKGKITSLNARVDVEYDRGVARFEDQIIITPGSFSAPGDSGSLIVTQDRYPVGLLFAGSSSTTIANPIDEVLAAFDVTIDGE